MNSFGSMIHAVADEKERDALGMHYTSVPNTLKALNPLSSTICGHNCKPRATTRSSY